MDEDIHRVRDWHCGECGERNRHWRTRCYDCRGDRADVEERHPSPNRGAARQATPARSGGGAAAAGQQPRTGGAVGPVAGTPAGAGGQVSAAVQGRSWAQAASAVPKVSLAAPPCAVNLRPGGNGGGTAQRGVVQANSGADGPAPQPREGRAGAGAAHPIGAQHGVRTVSVAEAGKGKADADGFIRVGATVGQRGRTCEGTDEGRRGQAAAGAGDDPGGAGSRNAAAASVEGEHMHVDEAADPGGEEQEEAQAADVDELRRYWEDAKELLAFAKRQGHAEDHPARRAAQRQVDDAFAEWRAATPPKAVHARMGWAEDALRRAQRAQTKAEQELEELDRRYEIDRQQCLQTLQAARDKTREREQKLAELSREAAEEYQGEANAGEGRLLRGTFRTLDAQVGPALEGLLAKMQKGSEEYSILHQALQDVTTMHAALGMATGGNATDFFDMAADDEGTTAHAARGAAAEPSDGTASNAMDTTEARAPRWLEPKRGGEPDPASSTGGQPPRWKKYRAEGGGGTSSSAGAQPAAEAGSAGAAAAAAAGAGGGGGSAPAAPAATNVEEQVDEFDARRQQIIQQAQSDSIDVPVDYLRQLCPEALEEWAKEHLL